MGCTTIRGVSGTSVRPVEASTNAAAPGILCNPFPSTPRATCTSQPSSNTSQPGNARNFPPPSSTSPILIPRATPSIDQRPPTASFYLLHPHCHPLVYTGEIAMLFGPCKAAKMSAMGTLFFTVGTASYNRNGQAPPVLFPAHFVRTDNQLRGPSRLGPRDFRPCALPPRLYCKPLTTIMSGASGFSAFYDVGKSPSTCRPGPVPLRHDFGHRRFRQDLQTKVLLRAISD